MIIILALVEIILGFVLLAAIFILKIDRKVAVIYKSAYPDDYWESKATLSSKLVMALRITYTERAAEVGIQVEFITVAVLNIAMGILAITTKDLILTPLYMAFFVLLSLGYVAIFMLRVLHYRSICRRRLGNRSPK